MHYLIHIADVVAAYIERVTAVTTIDRWTRGCVTPDSSDGMATKNFQL